MKVSVDSEIPREEEPIRVAGRGQIEEEGNAQNVFIYQIDLPVLSKQKCEELNVPINTTSRFCAGYNDRKCDLCAGDGGSPVIQYDKSGNPVLVGLSVGFLCGGETEDSYPYPFNRIAQFESYLRNPEYNVEFASTQDLPSLRPPAPSSKPSESLVHLPFQLE